jgi:transaldolase
MNPLETLHQLGQSIWIDAISREMLRNGKLQSYIERHAVTGLHIKPEYLCQGVRAWLGLR